MKECECLKNKRIRPFDTCIFCAHKHVAAALSLYNYIDFNEFIKFRIISQLNLSKWHLNSNYKDLIVKYDNIIYNILFNNDFKDDLTNLVEILWDLCKENKTLKMENNENLFVKYDKNLKLIDGLICISNALELLKYEHFYKDLNYSYAIGQLNLAVWIFQDINILYAKQCRDLYKNIELNEIDFNLFKYLIIEIYKEITHSLS